MAELRAEARRTDFHFRVILAAVLGRVWGVWPENIPDPGERMVAWTREGVRPLARWLQTLDIDI